MRSPHGPGITGNDGIGTGIMHSVFAPYAVTDDDPRSPVIFDATIDHDGFPGVEAVPVGHVRDHVLIVRMNPTAIPWGREAENFFPALALFANAWRQAWQVLFERNMHASLLYGAPPGGRSGKDRKWRGAYAVDAQAWHKLIRPKLEGLSEQMRQHREESRKVATHILSAPYRHMGEHRIVAEMVTGWVDSHMTFEWSLSVVDPEPKVRGGTTAAAYWYMVGDSTRIHDKALAIELPVILVNENRDRCGVQREVRERAARWEHARSREAAADHPIDRMWGDEAQYLDTGGIE